MMTRTRQRLAAILAAMLLPLPLLANNITATALEGDLTLEGDSDGNSALVVDTGGGNIVVVGLLGTTVNDRPAARFAVGQLRGVFAALGGGADRLGLSGLITEEDVAVSLGEGNDLLFNVRPLEIGRSLLFDAGPGVDRISLTDTLVGLDLQLLADTGPLDASLTNLAVAQDVRIETQGGDDSITLREVDIAGAAQVSTRSGDDAVTLSNLALTALTVATAEGVDALRIEFLTATGDVALDTGTENDVAAVTDVTVGGNGALLLGAGEDISSGTRVNAQGEVLFDGGDGVDTLTDNGINGDSGTQIVNFEVILP